MAKWQKSDDLEQHQLFEDLKKRLQKLKKELEKKRDDLLVKKREEDG